MPVSAAQQAAALAYCRTRLASASATVNAMDDGDSKRNVLSALRNATREADALEKNAARRLAQPGPIGLFDTGGDLWLHDVRELDRVIDSLPQDAVQGTLEDVLRQTAAATATDTAQLAGKAVTAAGDAASFGVGAVWRALPLWAQAGLALAGVGVVGVVGWQGYQLATAPRRVLAAAGV